MGILNITPDSFSGDGVLYLGDAVTHGMHLLESGAEILDIGAESTRPGLQPVHEEEELERIIPVLNETGGTSQRRNHSRLASHGLEGRLSDMTIAAIALGSNLNDPVKNVSKALLISTNSAISSPEITTIRSTAKSNSYNALLQYSTAIVTSVRPSKVRLCEQELHSKRSARWRSAL